MSTITEHLLPSAFLVKHAWPLLDTICRDLFANSPASPEVGSQQTTLCAEIMTEIDVAILAGRWLASHPGVAMMAPSRTLFAGPTLFDQPFADGHVHVNGISGDSLVLAYLVMGPAPQYKDGTPGTLVARLKRVRRMLSAFIPFWLEPSQNTAVLLEACAGGPTALESDPHIDWQTWKSAVDVVLKARAATSPKSGHERLATPAPSAPGDPGMLELLSKMVDSILNLRLEQAWTLCFALLWRTFMHCTLAETRAMVLLFMAESMVLRRGMMLDGNGLRRFTQVFHVQHRALAFGQEWDELAWADRAQRLFGHKDDRAALKIAVESLIPSPWPKPSRDGTTATALLISIGAQTPQAERAPSDPAETTPTEPLAGDPPQIRAFAQAALARLKALGATELKADAALQHWHLCATFSRRSKARRADLWESAAKLHNCLDSITAWNVDEPKALPVTSPSCMALPSSLVRGLDVVGDETRHGIEMYAPMLRWLRSPRAEDSPSSTADIILPRRQRSLYLSVHAGEDYAHPLSGLRRVDETVVFCGMVKGDRLGHALALGIRPASWMAGHGEALLPLDEHVDNLIWAWDQARQLSAIAGSTEFILRVQGRLKRLLSEVSWLPQSLRSPEAATPETFKLLHEAWHLRKNCREIVASKTNAVVKDGQRQVGAPNYEELWQATRGNPAHSPAKISAADLYVARARTLGEEESSHLENAKRVRVIVPRYAKLSRRQEALETPNHLSSDGREFQDHDTADDLRFMEAIQDACLQRYATMELTIEANPSSNVAIGQLQTYSDHPIFRWHPPDNEVLKRHNAFGIRKVPMPVTVNTDDPGVIPTTLRMEHLLLSEGAVEHGYTDQQIKHWIEQLRTVGLRCFEQAMPASGRD